MTSKIRKLKIGSLISISDEINRSGENFPFFGVNINKEFMPTIASTAGLDNKKYKIVRKNRFVFSGMQTGRDKCIRIALYQNDEPVLVSPAYTTFEVTSPDILPVYFFMIFKSKEMDRYGAFLSDSSVRANLEWNRFCDIELEVPSIDIQQKFVNIYESLLNNLHYYESGLNDLFISYQGLIETYKKTYKLESISPYIEESKETNKHGKYRGNVLRGVGQDGFVSPKQKRDEKSLIKCGVFHKDDFIYNPSLLYSGAIALNKELESGICTEEYIIFHVKNKSILIPEYLFMWIKRKECGRFINFMSVDSVRNRVYYQDLKMIEIPIVSFELQKYAVDIYSAYCQRKQIVNELKQLISDICPILIRGSVLEAKGGKTDAN